MMRLMRCSNIRGVGDIETQTGLQDGKSRAESSFRVDPSARYAEQRIPLKIRGKPPTEKQLKEAADRGNALRSGDRAAAESAGATRGG